MKCTITPIGNINTVDRVYSNRQQSGSKENVSFKSTLLTLDLLRRVTLSLRRNYKSVKTIIEAKKAINPVFDMEQKNSKITAEVLTGLSLMRGNLDETLKYNIGETFVKGYLPKLSDMKTRAIKELVPKVDDTDGYGRTAKKAFMLSIFAFGEYMSDDYIQAFKEMPDSIYGKFKEDVADKALYSIDKYRPSSNPEQFLYNLELLKTLDKNNHASYYEKNRNGFSGLNRRISAESYKLLTGEKNMAHELYSSNFDINHTRLNDKINSPQMWKGHLEKVFYLNLLAHMNNIPKLAEALNVDEIYADDIVKDFYVLELASQTDNKEEKLAMFSERIEEKFRLPIVENELQKKKPAKFYAYQEKLQNITNFIDKTNMSDKLNTKYIARIEHLDDMLYNNFSASSDNNFNLADAL